MNFASIIISVYNQTVYLPGAVQSALAQTYPVEVIVVDDGSTEDVRLALRTDLPRVNLLRQENQGLASARNLGFRASRGDYLLFLDADDTLDPRLVETCIRRLETHPEMALVYCAWKQVSAQNGMESGRVIPAYRGQVLIPLLLRRFFFLASGTVIRRSMLEKVGLFDEQLRWGEDADLWLRAARMGFHFDFEPRPLLNYRIHPDSMTARVSPRQVQGWQAVLENFFASPNLPSDIAALRPEAYGVLYFETAGRFLRLGQQSEAREQLCLAASVMPAVEENWFLEWLAGTALDPRTERPLDFIRAVLEIFPPEYARFHSLHRRAVGRYHIAAAFSCFGSGQRRAARRHLWPAVWGDPSILANKGFLSMALKTIVPGKGER